MYISVPFSRKKSFTYTIEVQKPNTHVSTLGAWQPLFHAPKSWLFWPFSPKETLPDHSERTMLP